MSFALYRKYRPQSFDEVIGQNHIKVTLQHEVESGAIAHAYLFCGPRGLGKTTLARLFAKAINCENRQYGESEPCNKCDSCLAILENHNIDIIEIDAASHTGVDNVRENIIENARFTPNKSKYKVFIIDEVHMLSVSAFNALLKTLEEPPAHAIFILCTTEIHKLPPTIISRCQRFDFKKINSDELQKRLAHLVKLEKKQVAEEVLRSIVIYSDGCVRDAESLLGKILTLGDKITLEQAELILPHSDFGSVADFLDYLAEKNQTAAIALINQLMEDGQDLQVFVSNLLEFLRKVMLVKVSGDLSDYGIDLIEEHIKRAKSLAQKLNYEELVCYIELFLAKEQDMKTAAIPQLPLELAVVRLCADGACSKKNDDDDDATTGGGSVKTKIKEKLSHLNPRKDKDSKEKEEVKLSNLEMPKEKADTEEKIKVDMLSDQDKVVEQGKVDLNKVEEAWPQVVEALLEKNYTLSALLKISKPLKTRGHILEIGVRSAFYQGRLEELKNKRVVEEAISEIVKVTVGIVGIVCDDLEPLEFLPSEAEIAVKTEPVKATTTSEVVAPVKAADVVQDVISMF